MKVLGAKAFSYGYASPVLMAATYNDDGTVNVMNLHEVARTNAGDLACCIGKPKKTHENIEKRKAFTLTLANESLMKEPEVGLPHICQCDSPFISDAISNC